MPIMGPSRGLLTLSLVDLVLAGGLLIAGSLLGDLASLWDPLLWLLLIGFVQPSTLGFSLHLFPSVSRRLLPGSSLGPLPLVLLPLSVALGTLSLLFPGNFSPFRSVLPLAVGCLAAAVAISLARFLAALRRPALRAAGREDRPGDEATLPLFLLAWLASLGAAVLFLLSTFSEGPGYGWWVAGVHLFVLGHATLLVAAVSLRMVPRSLSADPPVSLVRIIAASAAMGGFLVPLGMLFPRVLGPQTLDILAAPEGLFALLSAGTLVLLGVQARTFRPQLALHLTGFLILLAGGGVGLWMVSTGDLSLYRAHAGLNLLGFLGLTILVMWFGMIAPFQRISHVWTRRMLWGLSIIWVTAVVVLSLSFAHVVGFPDWALAAGAAMLLGVGVGWLAGSLPVLYPGRRPAPGPVFYSSGRVRGRGGSRP